MELLKKNAEDHGYLKIILGPMFSGKTTELMRIYNRYNNCDIPCCVINHTMDQKRWNDINEMTNHNGSKVPCVYIETLKEAIPLVDKYDIFLINEGQFFEDLYDVVNLLSNLHKKKVYISGLDGDFKRRKFGSILDVIPLCDDIVKLKAICKRCKKKDAIYTHRLTHQQEQTLIGADNYTALCRTCYNMNVSTTPPIRKRP
jgi:thymidine kinase